MLHMRVVEKLDNYLRLPLHIGKKKSLPFNGILNRFSCRINSWSKRLLSYGGREVFNKSILQALPTYALYVFLALRGIIKEMHSKMRRMWWSCKDKDRGWAMLAWDKICLPKGIGGLRFRDFRLFNMALLGRHVLSSKYFPEGNLFYPKKVDKHSFTWNSIATAARALEKGFGWLVGDSNRVHIHLEWGLHQLQWIARA
ncbi:putative purine permease 4 [Gossypium australe]|uniref:Putative purine permease 4 n=1 Tax=Gossypium australe TaxID=47621 RepID=A0A5B6UT57_9ROSI|nr:putative purine permease 4 [Gossypium australe]